MDCPTAPALYGEKDKNLGAQVLVASPGKGMQMERIRLAGELWAADISAEFGYKANPNFKESLQTADDAGIPFLLVLGESELREVCDPLLAWQKSCSHRLLCTWQEVAYTGCASTAA